MKQISIAILLTLATLTAASCRHIFQNDKETTDRLEAIWNLSEQDPDSAALECLAIEDSISRCTEYERKLYDLLNIRIRIKKDMPASSIDSIKAVAEYMERHGTGKDRMRAYYYLGSIYDDLNDSPHSVTFALKASSFADTPEECDTDIMLKVYSLLSCVYRKQNNLKESTEMALKGLNLSKQAHKVDCWSYMDVATAYSLERNQKEKMKYYNLAYQTLLADQNSINEFSIASELAYTFAREKEYEKVDTLISIMEKLPYLRPSHHYYYAMGVVCKEKNDTESAIAAFKKALACASSSPHAQQAALANLFALHYSEGEYQKAAEYAMQYQNCNRIINTEAQREWTQNAKGEYNYIKEKAKEEALIREKDYIIMGGACIIFLIVVAVVGIGLFAWKRFNEKQERLAEKEEELKSTKRQYAETKEQLEEQKSQTDKLSKQLLFTKAMKKDKSIIAHFSNVAKGHEKLKDDSWNALYTTVETEHPGFGKAVREKYPGINEDTMHTCYLLKVGMTNAQIENITNSSRQTTWYRIKHLQDAIGDLLLPNS